MKNFIASLKREEQVLLELRKLYELLAYKKTSLSRFEDYELYTQYKHVLDSDGILSFTDHVGKLLALRPDATLSLLRNSLDKGAKKWDKLYYLEHIYRRSSQSGEFKEFTQLGIEYFDELSPYANLEVIHLALRSLETIHPNFILCLSHLGYIEGLFHEIQIDQPCKKQIMQYIASKNTHDLDRILETLNIPQPVHKGLLACTKMYGSFDTLIDTAETYILNNLMSNALLELKHLHASLKKIGEVDKIQIDFSLTANLDFYNGFVFHGYVENLPQYILAGGRYDQLAQRFGHKDGAIGFAVFMNELDAYYPPTKHTDFDVLLEHSATTDINAVMEKVKELNNIGFSVRISNAGSEDEQLYSFRKKIEM